VGGCVLKLAKNFESVWVGKGGAKTCKEKDFHGNNR